ncbi:hypothetical protein FNV43_RR12377 [Rhamnella rubrinervis]|uniref:Uncharacterized protein n=1 Tax=Rhamnella rubrinervis TaxID=2594499 RepID=A0A8K0H786_9ROSA|nr:hypothetical protein FNV43_RR12377 [Rhamnella rubrinervis]
MAHVPPLSFMTHVLSSTSTSFMAHVPPSSFMAHVPPSTFEVGESSSRQHQISSEELRRILTLTPSPSSPPPPISYVQGISSHTRRRIEPAHVPSTFEVDESSDRQLQISYEELRSILKLTPSPSPPPIPFVPQSSLPTRRIIEAPMHNPSNSTQSLPPSL